MVMVRCLSLLDVHSLTNCSCVQEQAHASVHCGTAQECHRTVVTGFIVRLNDPLFD